MINRLRTLLLNSSLEGAPGFPYPGEELIPADYLPRTLPPYLQNVYAVLFGSNPDRLYLNYRLSQYLSLMSSARLLDDTMSTYDPRSSPQKFAGTFGLFSEGSENLITVSGEAVADEPSGRCVIQWQVEVVDSQHVAVKQLTAPVSSTTYVYDTSQGVGGPVSLNKAVSCSFAPVVGASWTVSSRGRPTRSLSEVMKNLEALGERLSSEVFGANPPEPLLTYQNMWRRHPFWNYRMAALVKSLALRIEDLYLGVPA